MTHKTKGLLMAAVLLLTVFVTPPPASTEEAATEEPSAEEVLRQASNHFASMDGFRILATIESDEVPEPGIKVESEAALEMIYARPDRLRVDYRDDDLSKTLWIGDGKATLYDPSLVVYSSVAVEGDVSAALQTLGKQYDVGVPLDDFLVENPYERLSAGIERRRYLGIHQVGGVAAHHAVFDRGDISWQIWVAVGDAPELLKLVITHGDEEAAPRYAIEIDELEAGAPSDAAFKVDLPEDASKIAFEDVTIGEGS